MNPYQERDAATRAELARLQALEGKPADETLPAGVAPPEMTGEEAVAIVTAHLEGVRRKDPEALALDQEVGAEFRRRQADAEARSQLVAAIMCKVAPLSLAELQALHARLEGRTASLQWGERYRLAARRGAVNRSAEVGGTKVHLGINTDAGGAIKTIWIDVAKEGSPVRGLLHVVAGVTSIALQHGAPVESIAKVMSEPEFDPAGKVTEAHEGDAITSAKSIPDYVAQVLLLEAAELRAKR